MKKRIPIIIFIISLALFVLGIVLGEPGIIFRKSIMLCLSCIGLG